MLIRDRYWRDRIASTLGEGVLGEGLVMTLANTVGVAFLTEGMDLGKCNEDVERSRPVSRGCWFESLLALVF